MGRALLLTGEPGVGKTTLIRKVVAELGSSAAGFYTEEIREQGRRSGFRLVTLDGRVAILASVNKTGPYRVGKYGVHLRDLEAVGVEALRRAIARPDVSVVVVDEIGRMELLSIRFREIVLAALDSPKPVLGTVMAGTQPWVEALVARPGVTVLEVRPSNRESLSEQILRWLRPASVGV